MKIIRRKHKAFTLIEIIVVLIILGVLASLALPAYFSWVSRSRSAEAFGMIKSIKDNMIPCLQVHPGSESNCYPAVGSLTTCTAGPPINCSPSGAVGQYNSPNFYYQINSWYNFGPGGSDFQSGNPQDFTVYAKRLPISATDSIVMAYRASDGTIVCWGTGIYRGTSC